MRKKNISNAFAILNFCLLNTYSILLLLNNKSDNVSPEDVGYTVMGCISD